MRVWVVSIAAVLSLLGVCIAGTLTRDAVRHWDRSTFAFTAIDCTPPPGQERLDFLTEVQYLAGMPNQLSVLDDGLASRIADAFARHPCVEKVEKVILLPAPNKGTVPLSSRGPSPFSVQVIVRLRFRSPGKPAAVAD